MLCNVHCRNGIVFAQLHSGDLSFVKFEVVVSVVSHRLELGEQLFIVVVPDGLNFGHLLKIGSALLIASGESDDFDSLLVFNGSTTDP